MRTLATVGLLSQIEEHRWRATPLAVSCVIPTIKSGLKFLFDFVGPVFQKLPESLAKSHYRCPTALQGPLQDTYDTKLSGYDYIMDPRWVDTLKDCNLFMKGRRDGSTSWLEFYPFSERILADAEHDARAVTVVDVGGGLGHGLLEIKDKYPDMKGRLVLQDLPNTIEQAGDGQGVFEPTAHDFFTPQPVKGESPQSTCPFAPYGIRSRAREGKFPRTGADHHQAPKRTSCARSFMTGRIGNVR